MPWGPRRRGRVWQQGHGDNAGGSGEVGSGQRCGRDRQALQGHGHGPEAGVLREPTGPSRPPSEKRVLLVKELQGLTAAQRDHMLRAMPLSLAEKRCLRSVPHLLRPRGPPPPGQVVGRTGLQQAVPGGGWAHWLGPPQAGPDAASARREETRAPRGHQGHHGPLPCCSRLRYACVLVGASRRVSASRTPIWEGAGWPSFPPLLSCLWGPLTFHLRWVPGMMPLP